MMLCSVSGRRTCRPRRFSRSTRTAAAAAAPAWWSASKYSERKVRKRETVSSERTPFIGLSWLLIACIFRVPLRLHHHEQLPPSQTHIAIAPFIHSGGVNRLRSRKEQNEYLRSRLLPPQTDPPKIYKPLPKQSFAMPLTKTLNEHDIKRASENWARDSPSLPGLSTKIKKKKKISAKAQRRHVEELAAPPIWVRLLYTQLVQTYAQGSHGVHEKTHPSALESNTCSICIYARTM